MLEFVFFDPRPRDVFLSQLKEAGVEFECCQKGDELLVLLSDDIESGTIDRIEQYYEGTLQMSEELMAEAEGVDHFNLAGVEVKLKNGPVMATVDSKLLAKLLSVLNFDELGRFVDSIAKAAEEPDMRPLCKR
jgi:hypothetical protein